MDSTKRALIRRLAVGLVSVGVAVGTATVTAAPAAHAANTCRTLTSVSTINGAFHWVDCQTTSPHAPYYYRAYVSCWAPNRSPATVIRHEPHWMRSDSSGWSKAYCQYHETREYYGVYKQS